jgi:hypothetical protein
LKSKERDRTSNYNHNQEHHSNKTSNASSIGDDHDIIQESDPLLAAYISLLSTRIPCHWRYSEQQPAEDDSNQQKKSNLVERELWVFWLNDRSSIQEHGLEKLKGL